MHISLHPTQKHSKNFVLSRTCSYGFQNDDDEIAHEAVGKGLWGGHSAAFALKRFLGSREEAALVGRCWIRMGPPQVLDRKAGRCPQNAT